jgi:hypothetical protein
MGQLLADPVAEARQKIRWYAEPEQEQPGGE